MPSIHVLDKNVAELIAAGEVIERPASIVKELLENAIDSGASQIHLEIGSGGIGYIRISDNGCGISYEDVPKAFLRHATSKVQTEDDLDGIGTLGFRGEALASICAVAKVEMVTKPADADFGTRYVIEGGEEQEHTQTGASSGTTIIVRDLFYNVPARLKFLKKDYAEASAIASIVDKIALSHPHLSIKFIKDKKLMLNTPGNNDLYSAVYAVFGKEFASSLTKTEYEYQGIKVYGYTSIPMMSRANRSMQHFFINGRYVKSKTCAIALEEAYKNSIMVGKFPACILNIEMSLDAVDVNVHPAKIEVRFVNERKIFDAVYFSVKSALSVLEEEKLQSESTMIDHPVESKRMDVVADIAGFQETEGEQGTLPTMPSIVNMTKSSPSTVGSYSEKAEIAEPEPAKKEFNFSQTPPAIEKFARITYEEDTDDRMVSEAPDITVTAEVSAPEPPAVYIRVVGEIFRTYILAQVEEKFLIIDKHAAHERVIFEKLKESKQDLDRQILLSAFTVTLTKEEYTSVLENQPLFHQFGFEVEDYGNGTVCVREIPLILDQANSRDVFLEIAGNVAAHKQHISPEILEDLYASMSCKAAIKANDQNSREELEELVQNVYYDDTVRYCPHGRPVIIALTKAQIEKMFGRIV